MYCHSGPLKPLFLGFCTGTSEVPDHGNDSVSPFHGNLTLKRSWLPAAATATGCNQTSPSLEPWDLSPCPCSSPLRRTVCDLGAFHNLASVLGVCLPCPRHLGTFSWLVGTREEMRLLLRFLGFEKGVERSSYGSHYGFEETFSKGRWWADEGQARVAYLSPLGV